MYMSMNKVSVIIITHRTDDRFIKSVESAAFADEIIIVTFGNLSLPDFHPKFSPKIKHVRGGEQIQDFALARNQALEKASSEWVLFLDSDEIIEPSSVAIIQEKIQQPGLAGIFVQRQDVFYGRKLKWGETGRHWLLRLAARSTIHFERPVHEVAVVDGVKSMAPIVLLHYAHPTISDFWQAISRYSLMEAQYRANQNQRFSIWQLIFYPPAKFILNYFLKLGFLDGWQGLVYAIMMSIHSLMVRVFLYEATH